jgi:hypothetical protein
MNIVYDYFPFDDRLRHKKINGHSKDWRLENE